MIKQAIQTQVCDSCGADIRPGALFCYHCGAQVANIPATENGKAKKRVPIAEDISKVVESSPVKSPETEKPSRSNNGNLKASPAAARRKIVKKEAEAAKFVWVEKENTSNVWFVVAAIIIVLIAAIVLIAMLYIR